MGMWSTLSVLYDIESLHIFTPDMEADSLSEVLKNASIRRVSDCTITMEVGRETRKRVEPNMPLFDRNITADEVRFMRKNVKGLVTVLKTMRRLQSLYLLVYYDLYYSRIIDDTCMEDILEPFATLRGLRKVVIEQ